MAADRRTTWLAIALATVLVVAAVVWLNGRSSTPGGTPTARAAAPTAQDRAAGGNGAPEHVKLEALKGSRGEPANASRNPFRFQGSRQATAPGGLASLPPPTPVNQGPTIFTPVLPSGPPPPPPIPLKFIGIVTQGSKRIAVLSDGRSTPQSGAEGAIILGQYRILKIGEESIEMAYVDGRGRQTIRLTGQ